jgi:hypothetical protein
MAVTTSLGYKLKSIQDVKGSIYIFPAFPVLAIDLVYGKQYLFFHSPLSNYTMFSSGITIMETFF